MDKVKYQIQNLWKSGKFTLYFCFLHFSESVCQNTPLGITPLWCHKRHRYVTDTAPSWPSSRARSLFFPLTPIYGQLVFYSFQIHLLLYTSENTWLTWKRNPYRGERTSALCLIVKSQTQGETRSGKQSQKHLFLKPNSSVLHQFSKPVAISAARMMFPIVSSKDSFNSVHRWWSLKAYSICIWSMRTSSWLSCLFSMHIIVMDMKEVGW